MIWRALRRSITTLAVLVLLLPWGSEAVWATSLEEAVGTAIKTDPRVTAALAGHRAAKLDIREARAGYFPRVDLNGSFGREKSNIKSQHQAGLDNRFLNRREFGLQLNQMIYDGLFTSSEVDRRESLLSAAGSSARDVREQVAFSTVQAYLDVLRNRRLVSLAEDNAVEHEAILGKVVTRRTKGIGTDADRSQASARFALARSVLTAREGRLREAVTYYKRLVGEYPQALEDLELKPATLLKVKETEKDKLGRQVIDKDKLNNAIRGAIDESAQAHPALQAAQAQVGAVDAEARGVKSSFLPRLDLQINSSRDSGISGVEGIHNSDNIMLVGSWNLFRGGADSARQKAIAERRTVAQDTAADTRKAISERVSIAVQAKATSEERLQYLDAHVENGEQTLKSYQAQLRLGRRTLLDSLNAANELFTARSNQISGKYEDILNAYFIEASKGTLVKVLGLGD